MCAILLIALQISLKLRVAITKIAQSGNHIAVASAAMGGDADPPEDIVSGHRTFIHNQNCL